MMRAAARFHPDHAARQLRNELLHLATSQLPSDNDCSSGINAVNLEHVLRQIQTNHANLAHGRSPLSGRLNITSLAR
jgi:hypothetical protein